MIKILVDENVAIKVKNGLVDRGYTDTKHINDIQKGLPDDIVFKIATEEERVLISGDDDFKDETFKYNCGIIWITPKAKIYVKDSIDKICWILDKINDYNINIHKAFISITRNSYVILYKKGMNNKLTEKEIKYNKIKEFIQHNN